MPGEYKTAVRDKSNSKGVKERKYFLKKMPSPKKSGHNREPTEQTYY